MTNNEKYFLNLISCFLNSVQPKGKSENWKEIYELGQSQQLIGIIGQCVKMLPAQDQPKSSVLKVFSQIVGKTISYNDEKTQAQKELQNFFESNSIDYLFVKGESVSKFYPIPDLRLSSDIDVIVREDKFDEVVSLIKKTDYKIVADVTKTFEIEINGYAVEIHRDSDVFGRYFDNIFDKCDNEGCRYWLNPYDNLMYVILHLVKHLSSYGAGLKMLMDIDVCIRSIDNFDVDYFLDECEKAGVRKCTEILFAICKLWFATPVDIDVIISDEMLGALEKTFLRGGVYGFELNSLGGLYLSRTGTQAITFRDRIKAFLILLFPSVDTIIYRYPYVEKHRILIPFGYIQRFFEAVFQRGGHSLNTIKDISSSGNDALMIEQIKNELDIQ